MKKTIAIIISIIILIASGIFIFLSLQPEKEEEANTEPSISDQLRELEDNDILELEINNKILKLEVARSSEKKSEGLMFREELDGIDGMIFVYDTIEYLQFWMKNTLISLDIIYLDSNLRVVNLYKNTKVNQTNERYPSNKGAQFVIELEGGSAEILDIRIDSEFSIIE